MPSVALDDRQLRVLDRARAEAGQLQAEAERLQLLAGEVMNDAVGVVLQAHGHRLEGLGDVFREGRELRWDVPAVSAPPKDESGPAAAPVPAAPAPKPRPPAARVPAPVNLGGA